MQQDCVRRRRGGSKRGRAGFCRGSRRRCWRYGKLTNPGQYSRRSGRADTSGKSETTRAMTYGPASVARSGDFPIALFRSGIAETRRDYLPATYGATFICRIHLGAPIATLPPVPPSCRQSANAAERARVLTRSQVLYLYSTTELRSLRLAVIRNWGGLEDTNVSSIHRHHFSPLANAYASPRWRVSISWKYTAYRSVMPRLPS